MADYTDYQEGVAANAQQVGGKHYGTHDYQHWDYAWDRGFNSFQYPISKYVERHEQKNGRVDLEKALHYLDKYIELAATPGIILQRFTSQDSSRRVWQSLRRYAVERDFDPAQLSIFEALEENTLPALQRGRTILVTYMKDCYPA